jgi:hypothetical protein
MSKADRCMICGKEIIEGTIYKVYSGTIKGGKVVKAKEFGAAHEMCFQKTLPTREATMEELRKLVGEL